MDMSRCALASLLIMALGLADASNAREPPASTGGKNVAFVRWYEGLNLEQDNFCTTDISTRPYYLRTKFSDVSCSNDEARSVQFQNLPPGSTIWVYDSKNCGESDDWGKATVLKQAASLAVGDFNHTFTTDGLRYESHYHNGINGKLSCFIIDVPGNNGERAANAPHDP